MPKKDETPTEFLMRELVFESDKGYRGVDIRTPRVTRTRTSSGFASISATAEGKTISFNNEEGNVEYEEQARTFARLILAAVDDPCELPG